MPVICKYLSSKFYGIVISYVNFSLQLATCMKSHLQRKTAANLTSKNIVEEPIKWTEKWLFVIGKHVQKNWNYKTFDMNFMPKEWK